MTDHTPAARIRQLQDYIQQGKILDAMTEFYDTDIAMQENDAEPVVGLDVNIEREKQFLAQIKDFISYEPIAIAAEGDTTFVESRLEFINQQDQRVVLTQAARQRWNNGKITHETFYHG